MFSQPEFDAKSEKMAADVQKLIVTTLAASRNAIPPSDTEWTAFYDDVVYGGNAGYGKHFVADIMQDDKQPNRILFAVTPKTAIAAQLLASIRLVLGNDLVI